MIGIGFASCSLEERILPVGRGKVERKRPWQSLEDQSNRRFFADACTDSVVDEKKENCHNMLRGEVLQDS